MTREARLLRSVLRCAERLLEARHGAMLTDEEWEHLERAAAACRGSARGEAYRVDPDGALVRSVTPAKGTPYEHRCAFGTLRKVCHAIDEAADTGTTLEEIADAEGLPSSQAATALAFLKERGCVRVERRRTYPSGPGAFLDAMTEYHALREGASPG